MSVAKSLELGGGGGSMQIGRKIFKHVASIRVSHRWRHKLCQKQSNSTHKTNVIRTPPPLTQFFLRFTWIHVGDTFQVRKCRNPYKYGKITSLKLFHNDMSQQGRKDDSNFCFMPTIIGRVFNSAHLLSSNLHLLRVDPGFTVNYSQTIRKYHKEQLGVKKKKENNKLTPACK